MQILKAQFVNVKRAKHAMSGMQGIKALRFGSAIVWLSNIQNNTQATNTIHSHGGHTVKPSLEDERLLIESL